MRWLLKKLHGAILLLCFALLVPGGVQAQDLQLAEPYSAWQGIARVGEYDYVSSDRDESFYLRNSISVYSNNALIKRKYYDFYDYSWGDINYINGKLYGTLYNYNAGGRPYQSKVAIVDPQTLKILKTYKIGGSVAECVVLHKGYFWVGYHNRKLIRKYSLSFKVIKDYPIYDGFPNSARTQGMFFNNGLLYVQRHGPNTFGRAPAPGIDRYYFKKGGYLYKDTLKPLTYGTGQGVEYVDGLLIQNDRPNNSIETILLQDLIGDLDD